MPFDYGKIIKQIELLEVNLEETSGIISVFNKIKQDIENTSKKLNDELILLNNTMIKSTESQTLFDKSVTSTVSYLDLNLKWRKDELGKVNETFSENIKQQQIFLDQIVKDFHSIMSKQRNNLIADFENKFIKITSENITKIMFETSTQNISNIKYLENTLREFTNIFKEEIIEEISTYTKYLENFKSKTILISNNLEKQSSLAEDAMINHQKKYKKLLDDDIENRDNWYKDRKEMLKKSYMKLMFLISILSGAILILLIILFIIILT